MTHPLINFVLFQACWFAAVAGAAGGWPAAGPLVTAAWLAVHLASLGEARVSETWLLLAAGVAGYVVDSALVLLGVLEFPAGARLGGPSPLWMVTLWVAFAATLRHALGWLRGRYLVAALLGAAGGPAAYAAGEALGAIAIPDRALGLTAVGVAWLAAMPVLLSAAGHAGTAGAAQRAPQVRP